MSYELLADHGGQGFEQEVARILATDYLTFTGTNTLTATGSGQPAGIFTTLYNTTTNPSRGDSASPPGGPPSPGQTRAGRQPSPRRVAMVARADP